MLATRTTPCNTYEMQRAIVWYDDPREFLEQNHEALIRFFHYNCVQFEAEKHEEDILYEFYERVLHRKFNYDPSRGVPLFRYLFTSFRMLLLHCDTRKKHDDAFHQEYYGRLERFNDEAGEIDCRIDLAWLEKRLKDKRQKLALHGHIDGYNLKEIGRSLNRRASANTRAVYSLRHLKVARKTYAKMLSFKPQVIPQADANRQYSVWQSFTKVIGVKNATTT